LSVVPGPCRKSFRYEKRNGFWLEGAFLSSSVYPKNGTLDGQNHSRKTKGSGTDTVWISGAKYWG
jgi:hypothetical protein